MKRLVLVLALLLTPSVAWSQCTGVFPNNTFCGNVTGATSTPRATALSSIPTDPISIGTTVVSGGTNTYLLYNNNGLLGNEPFTTFLANPSGSVGLTAVNGTAATAIRSDGAPALSSTVQSALTGTNHNVLLGTGAFGVGSLAPSSTVGIPLVSTGATTDPAFGTATVPGGGTGATTFTSNLPLIGAGAGAITQGTRSGNTTSFATTSGTLTSGNCAKFDASGNVIDAGGVCETLFANPTASVGLTTVNGAATTAMRSDGAPALSQSIVPTWTGSHIFNPVSGDAITINPAAASTAKGVVVAQTGTTTTTGADFSYNSITASQDHLNTYTGSNRATYGLLVTLNTGGATAKGQKYALRAIGNIAYGSTVMDGDIVGLSGWAISPQPQGGGVGTEVGTLYGGEFAGWAFSGATNLLVVSGGEANANINTGASAAHRWGWSIVGNGDLRGSISDAALHIGAATSGGTFKNAIYLDNTNGLNPLTTTGCVICTDATAVPITTGIDLSAYTISGDFLKGPGGFGVSGAGVVRVSDGVVNGLFSSTTLFTNSVQVGTFTSHPFVFITNNTLAGYFDTAQGLNLGQATLTQGLLNIRGLTSGVVSVGVQAAAGTYNFNLPTTAGTGGQCLASGGGGASAMTWAACSGGGLTVGTSTITSGTTTRILYDNAGVLGEYTLTGTGTVVAMQTAPTFVTEITSPVVKLSGVSNQLIFQSGGVTGTLSWAPATTGKTITLPNGTTDFTATSGVVQQASVGAAFTVGAVTSVNGVTHPASYTSGGIPYASSTSAISSSAVLGAGQVVVGGGAGATPATISNGQLPATATNDSASAGKVGEYTESVITSGSAVSLTDSVVANLTSVSLTAGDWDLICIQSVTGNASTLVQFIAGSLNTVSATLDLTPGKYYQTTYPSLPAFNTGNNIASSFVGPYRVSLSGTTTYYCVTQVGFTVSTASVYGIMRARRVR